MIKSIMITASGEIYKINSLKEAVERVGKEKAIIYAIRPIHTLGYNKASKSTKTPVKALESTPDANNEDTTITVKQKGKPGRKSKNKK